MTKPNITFKAGNLEDLPVNGTEGQILFAIDGEEGIIYYDAIVNGEVVHIPMNKIPAMSNTKIDEICT